MPETGSEDKPSEIISVLQYFIDYLEEYKKSDKDGRESSKLAPQLMEFLDSLSFSQTTRGMLQISYNDLRRRIHHRIVYHEADTPENTRRNDTGYDNMINSLQSLIENPVIKLKKKKIVLEQKQSFWDKVFKNKSKSSEDSKVEDGKKSESDEKPLELEVSHDDPSGKIKVFISHKFVKSDQILAEKLRKKLDEHNIFGYNAKRKKEYDVVFEKKIKQDIETSDYLIAIITINSQYAPSVHQEIGCALGAKVPVRLMVEENEAKGVLVEGKDMEKFSRPDFEKYLGNIIQDIQRKGIRDKSLSTEKWSEKPVFAFSLSFVGNRLNLNCKNIGNGLAKNIDLVIKTKGEDSLNPELKVTKNGLGKGDSFLINNWQLHGWVGIGAYEFDCEVSGSCQDIFGNNHSINEKLHFDNIPS